MECVQGLRCLGSPERGPGEGLRCRSDAVQAHFGGGSATRTLSRGWSWGGGDALGAASSAGCGIAGSSTWVSVPEKSWPGGELL